MTDLAGLTDEELEAKNQELMAERAEVEIRVKEAQTAVQAEVTKRANEAGYARLAGSMSQEERDALTAYMDANPPTEDDEADETPDAPAEEN